MEKRYKVLLRSSIIWMGICFVYDIPAALNNMMPFGKDKSTEYKINLLYSAYALPNIISPMVFGWATDINITFISRLLAFFVFLGHLIFTIGLSKRSLSTMILGRIILGIGGESMSVIQNKMISSEFKGKDLSFAMGLFSSLARLGTILNFFITPLLAHHINPNIPCYIGILLVFNGMILCIFFRDKKNVKELIMIPQQEQIVESQKTVVLEGTTIESVEKENNRSIFFNPNPNDSPYEPWEEQTKETNSIVKQELKLINPKILFEEKNVIFFEPNLKDERGFHSSFFLLVTISFTFAIVWAPFYAISTLLFQARYGMTNVGAGHLVAIQEIISLVFNPIVGKMADKIGYKLLFVLIGATLLLLSHTFILLKIGSPYFVILLLSISGTFINCYWPCIPNLVSESNLTKGFAFLYCVLNFAFTFSPMFVSVFVRKKANYDFLEIYIISIVCITVSLVVLLVYLNSKYSLGLNDKAEKYTD